MLMSRSPPTVWVGGAILIVVLWSLSAGLTVRDRHRRRIGAGSRVSEDEGG